MKTIAFFNNKGGVGKTSLVYHLAWMFADLGYRVVAADLDPQASLTAMFLEEERLAELWEDEGVTTIHGAVEPLGDIRPATLVSLNDQLALLPGDVGLSAFEDVLADGWGKCHQGDPRGYLVVSSLARVLVRAANDRAADVVLVDVGPSLGAINRAALLGADHIVLPVAADLFSIVGLEHLGPTLRRWRQGWQRLLATRPPELEHELPKGELAALGYVTMLYAISAQSRPTQAHHRWMKKIPEVYRRAVLDLEDPAPASVETDPECLGVLKHYRSLLPMAQDARKPIFRLRPADGAMGSHARAVHDAHRDFEQLARSIARRGGVEQ
ncbi:ParA family protein [Paraliomyxa miuraensis]|uniref:ParA family protein n=1 Tax=Paraliomyxa miuraensis TaxID=376150 RepID=UPI0022538E3F|nr:ParA family protein [Paraliomyxa miuraensis]MCX4244155.1 ParA family protein [Paraliomyxa miuraensis]